jgi:hypothetical protein
MTPDGCVFCTNLSSTHDVGCGAVASTNVRQGLIGVRNLSERDNVDRASEQLSSWLYFQIRHWPGGVLILFAPKPAFSARFGAALWAFRFRKLALAVDTHNQSLAKEGHRPDARASRRRLRYSLATGFALNQSVMEFPAM